MSLFDSLLEDSLIESADRYVKTREVWFAIRSDGAGTGTGEDPYDGSDRDRFDRLLLLLPTNVVIHLGSGIFRTRGGIGNQRTNPAWVPKDGQKIVGAGMFGTILKLELDQVEDVTKQINHAFSAIGHGYPAPNLTSYEISDLTIDCNMDGQPPSTGKDYARVMCQGIILKGNGLIVRRVRVINWSTRTPDQECFPIYLLRDQEVFYPLNNVIEDCIVERPSWNNVRETTCIQSGVERNNLVRCDLRKPESPSRA